MTEDAAELAVIGIVLDHPQILANGSRPALTGAHFRQPHTGQVWDCMLALADTGNPVDPILLTKHLQQVERQPHRLRQVLGVVEDAVGHSGVGENLDHYVHLVIDGYQRRRLDDLASRIRSRLDQGDDPSAITVTIRHAIDETGAAEDGGSGSVIIAPIDWRALFAADDPEPEWIVHPLLPEKRHIAIFSAPKVGKSLLVLEIAVAVSRGAKVLGDSTKQMRVLYVDFENDPRGDIRTRLEAMGHEPDDLNDLVYLTYPDLGALNSSAGAQTLLNHVHHYGCGLVVIDTVSRAVVGEENSNDTWNSFYAQTGLRLKRDGVALIRLDHSGKDPSKGQRGGSAKAGDVDAIWELRRVSETVLTLKCAEHRFQLVEDELTLHRVTDPVLRHTVAADAWKAERDSRIDVLIEQMNRLQIPVDHGRDKVRDRFKHAGVKARNDDISEAIRRRQNLSRTGQLQILPESVPAGQGQPP